MGITALTSTTATINVASTPQEITLSIGEEEKFEVSGDNYYDLKVKLNSITGNKADITVQSINELMIITPIVDDTEEDTTPAEDIAEVVDKITEKVKSNEGYVLIIVGVIIVIIIIVALAKKRKK